MLRLLTMTTALVNEPGPSPDETIRRTVRALRSAHEVDAKVLARHLGISRGSLYNRLNGAAPWLAAEIPALAAFFGCEIGDFYTGNVRIVDASAIPGASRRYQDDSDAVVIAFPQVKACGPDDELPITHAGRNQPVELKAAS